MVRGRTVDLMVPAEAELVIEGYVDPDYLEPEGPFGESHGYVALEDFNLIIEVTAITRRKDAVITSDHLAGDALSESSVVKRLAYEPMYLAFLRDTIGRSRASCASALHEPLTNLRKFVILQFARGTQQHLGGSGAGSTRRSRCRQWHRQVHHRGRRGHRS